MDSAKTRPFFKKRDIFFLIFILITALAIFFITRGIQKSDISPKACLYIDGTMVFSVQLSQYQKQDYKSIYINDEITLAVEKGAICFEKVDCPDQICVRAGWLNKAGQQAVCLPNKAVLKLVSGKGAGVDAIIR